MTINATDEEREIMKDLYTTFERVYDMTGTEAEWANLIRDSVRQIEKHKDMARQLAYHLFMGLIDYKEDQQKARMAAAMASPVQVSTEDIPWN